MKKKIGMIITAALPALALLLMAGVKAKKGGRKEMRIRTITALAALFLFPFFSAAVYAAEIDQQEYVVIAEETPAPGEISLPGEAPVTDYAEAPPRPFTPSGTGTVIDDATDKDGKEFYTVMTPEENVFYLVIDRQRGQENVYFLNVVTEADLMALAEIPERPAPVMEEQPPSPVQPEPIPSPAPEKNGGSMGMMLLASAVALIGGGAGWYFKVYLPKQKKAGGDEEDIEPELYGGSDPDGDGFLWDDGEGGDDE